MRNRSQCYWALHWPIHLTNLYSFDLVGRDFLYKLAVCGSFKCDGLQLVHVLGLPFYGMVRAVIIHLIHCAVQLYTRSARSARYTCPGMLLAFHPDWSLSAFLCSEFRGHYREA